MPARTAPAADGGVGHHGPATRRSGSGDQGVCSQLARDSRTTGPPRATRTAARSDAVSQAPGGPVEAPAGLHRTRQTSVSSATPSGGSSPAASARRPAPRREERSSTAVIGCHQRNGRPPHRTVTTTTTTRAQKAAAPSSPARCRRGILPAHPRHLPCSGRNPTIGSTSLPRSPVPYRAPEPGQQPDRAGPDPVDRELGERHRRGNHHRGNCRRQPEHFSW